MVQNIKNRKLCFCGKLAGMSRKEAETLARAAGAVVSSAPRGDVNLIVIGEAVPPGKTRAELQSAFDGELQRAFESGRLETITETTFWEWLGLRPASDGAPPLYTPAALAELTGVAAAAVRLWYRLGFLKSESRVGNLPYFALEEIPAVKRLKALFEAGSSPRQVSRAIEQLRKAFPNDKRVLLHMSPTSDPRKILYADGAHRQDSGGQSFFDFDRLEPNPEFDRPGESIPRLEDAFRTDGGMPDAGPLLSELSGRDRENAVGRKVVDLCQQAWQQEEAGDLDGAITSCRAALLLGGPDTDISFQLAELLAASGNEEAARERYYAVLEADGRHLEAMTSLARLLDRLGRRTDAAELYRAALEIDPGYSEIHYHLGELLFRMGESARAEEHLLLFKAAAGRGGRFGAGMISDSDGGSEASDPPLVESADLLLRRIRESSR